MDPQQYPLPEPVSGLPPRVASTTSHQGSAPQNVIDIRVFLVNGESRNLRLDDRADVNDIIRFVLTRLCVNMEVARQLFGILLKYNHNRKAIWMQSGFTVQELLHKYCGVRPLEEWKLMLRVRVMPKTPHHLYSQDPVSFQYFYDQVLRSYLEDDSIHVDNDTAVKLGCLELRRFYKDMPQIALKKKENFTMLERDIGLEKFFKKSLLDSVKHNNLCKMVVNTFQQYESLTMEGCVFQFFNLLSKHHAFDTERFSNCAVGADQTLYLTSDVLVGPNCDIEYQRESGERRFLAAFADIQDIKYESELMFGGRVIIDMRNQLPTVVIQTAQLYNAVNLATLIDAYCKVYTTNPHSRITRQGNAADLRTPLGSKGSSLPVQGSDSTQKNRWDQFENVVTRSITSDESLYVAKHDFTTDETGQLSIKKGDKLKVSRFSDNQEWCECTNVLGEIGWVPASYIAKVISLEKYSWFHGNITRAEAELCLGCGINGSFLLRESESKPGQFSISLRYDGRMFHYRIYMDSHSKYYVTPESKFENLAELVVHHSKNPDGLTTVLRYPAPNPHRPPIYSISHEVDEWELNRADIEMGQKLGGGQSEEVYKAVIKKRNTTVAVKALKEESKYAQEFLKVAAVMKHLIHKNLVQLFGVCTRELPFYIIMEYMSKGNLLDYLRGPDSKDIKAGTLVYMTQQVASAMAYLESKNVIHRDLAAKHCLVGENYLIKVADFGLSRMLNSDIYKAFAGEKFHIKWTAPEALSFNRFSIKSDVWAFGILLWELFTYGMSPYPGIKLAEVCELLGTGYRMQCPEGCPDAIYEVMKRCWEWDPEDRPSFKEISDQLNTMSTIDEDTPLSEDDVAAVQKLLQDNTITVSLSRESPLTLEGIQQLLREKGHEEIAANLRTELEKVIGVQSSYLRELQKMITDEDNFYICCLRLLLVGPPFVGKTTTLNRLLKVFENIRTGGEAARQRSTLLANCTQALALVSQDTAEWLASQNLDEETKLLFGYLCGIDEKLSDEKQKY